MATEVSPNEWETIKAKIKSQWSRFSNNEIEAFKDNMHLIPEKIAQSYGYSRAKAAQEYLDFMSGLETLAARQKTKY